MLQASTVEGMKGHFLEREECSKDIEESNYNNCIIIRRTVPQEEMLSDHVLPNYDTVSIPVPGPRLLPLTFSIPKNLSLPSFRIGPAFSSMRSRGVGCGALGSFFGGALAAFLVS